jgi:glutamate-5-semialdehyde dehydrogenase
MLTPPLALLQDGPANVVPVKAEQYDDEFCRWI